MYLWFRCDLPYGKKNTVPEKCQMQDNDRIYKVEAFGENLSAAVQDLSDGFGLVMLYHDNIDNMGHKWGPDSQEECNTIILEPSHFFE